MTPLTQKMNVSAEGAEWLEWERKLAKPSCFDCLLEQEKEEEMESKALDFLSPRPQPSANGNAQIRWLQRALNRVSAFSIAENGLPSIQTRKVLQKFQAEQGLSYTGTQASEVISTALG